MPQLTRILNSRAVPLAMLVVLLMVVYGVVADAPSAVRLPFTIAFILLVPGQALIGLRAVEDPLMHLSAVIGVSLAVSMLAAQALVSVDAFTPTNAASVLQVLSMPGLVWQLVPRTRT